MSAAADELLDRSLASCSSSPSPWRQFDDWPASPLADDATPPPPSSEQLLLVDSGRLAAMCGWQECFVGGTVPVARHVHSFTLIEGEDRALLFGGYTSGSALLGDLHEFDLKRRRWRQLEPRGSVQPRYAHVAAHWNGYLWVYGGASKPDRIDGVSRYDLAANAWQPVQPAGDALPDSRWGHSAVVYGDGWYIFGGYGRAFFADLWRFDFRQLTWRLIPPRLADPDKKRLSPRQFHTAAVLRDRMYVACGTSHGSHFFDQLWAFDFAAEEWQLLSARAPPLYGAVMVPFQDSLYIHGGRMPTGHPKTSAKLWEYNTLTARWSDVQPRTSGAFVSPLPRHFHAGFIYDGQLVVHGGLTPRNTNEILLFAFHAFTAVAAQPSHLSCSAKIPYHDLEFLVGPTKESVLAHRCILWSKSSYFRAMLTQSSSTHLRSSSDPSLFIHQSTFPSTLTSIESTSTSIESTSSSTPIQSTSSSTPIQSTSSSTSTSTPIQSTSIQSSPLPASSLVQLVLPGVEPPEFRCLLDWLYTGTLAAVDPDRLTLLATAADHFNVVDLLHYCEQLLCLAVTADNAADLLDFAQQLVSLTQLRDACNQFVQSANSPNEK